MTFLRRVLKLQAALWALAGLAFLLAPQTLLTHALFIFASPNAVALLRLLGVASIVLAMLMVLVAQHAGETWYWAWAFALLEAGIATVSILHALVGIGAGSSGTWWWIAGVVSIGFCGLDLVGLVRAEQEKPVV